MKAAKSRNCEMMSTEKRFLIFDKHAAPPLFVEKPQNIVFFIQTPLTIDMLPEYPFKLKWLIFNYIQSF